jgi:NRPS condensation-like uncharacterized protein
MSKIILKRELYEKMLKNLEIRFEAIKNSTTIGGIMEAAQLKGAIEILKLILK